MAEYFEAIPFFNKKNKQISLSIPKRKIDIFNKIKAMPKKMRLKIESITW